MTPAVDPLILEDPAPRRVFGARPFHADGDLLSLVFAPDGSLWSVEEPGMLRHWDVDRLQQRGYRNLEEPATVWGFSTDARLVAAGSTEVTLWEVASGKTLGSWELPSWLTVLAFSPQGTHLATGHDDGSVLLWDVAGGRLLGEIQAHSRAVGALAFDRSGTRLASAGEDRLIKLWEVATGTAIGQLEGHTDRIPALAWHPDGTRLYSAGWDTTARVWDVAQAEPLILLNSHAAQVLTLALSPDGSLLACADSAQAIHIWDTASHKTLAVLPPQAAEIKTLAFSADSQRLAAGGGERVIRLWDRRRGLEGEPEADPVLTRTCLAVSPDGARLLSLAAGTALRIWDVVSGNSLLEQMDAGVLRAFAAGSDGRWAAVSAATPGNAGAADLALWDLKEGQRVRTLEGPRGPVTALAFRGDGRELATGGREGGDVWIWQVPAGEPHLLIPDAVGPCSVEALAYHPKGRVLAVCGIDWLATGGGDGHIALWDIPARRLVNRLQGGVTSAAFHPSGDLLATATLGQSVLLWDVEGGNIIAELLDHDDNVTCLAFSPDGQLLVSGSDDRSVRLWDTAGELLSVLELDTQVKALVFSPDGRFLFTGNGNTSCYQLDVTWLRGGRGR
jgi:WD40 repeat protein